MSPNVSPELEAEIAAVYADRDRAHMQPTIDRFEALLAAEAISDPALDRYRPAVSGNAEYLRERDSAPEG